MRKIRYTFVEVQCSVLVGKWQGIAPNGRLAAIWADHSLPSQHPYRRLNGLLFRAAQCFLPGQRFLCFRHLLYEVGASRAMPLVERPSPNSFKPVLYWYITVRMSGNLIFGWAAAQQRGLSDDFHRLG